MKVRKDPKTLAPEALLSLSQAAELMNASVQYVKERLSRGEIATIPWGRDLRIPRKAVTAWIDSQIESHAARFRGMDAMIHSLRPNVPSTGNSSKHERKAVNAHR